MISRMIRLLAFYLLPVFAMGCQFNQSFAPISPRHFFGSEQSRQGIVALEQGNLAEAEKRLEDAVKWNRNDSNNRRHYAEALWLQGKHQEALQQLDVAVQRGGQNSALLHISLAEKRLELLEFKTAHEHADEAVRLEPQNYRSWALRGRAKWMQATHQAGYAEHTLAVLHEARNDYLRAVSLAPNDAELLTELAVLQMSCGQPEQALATWLSVQNLYPQGGEPQEMLLGKMETLTSLQRFDEAESTMLTMRRRRMSNPEAERRLQETMTAAKEEVWRQEAEVRR